MANAETGRFRLRVVDPILEMPAPKTSFLPEIRLRNPILNKERVPMRTQDGKIIARLLSWITSLPLLLFVLIGLFVLYEGAPLLGGQLREFVLGITWDPRHGVYGVLPMILGSILVTCGALLLSMPFGIASGILISEFLPSPAADAMRFLIFLMAGIPPVVYGFFGLVMIVPLVRIYLGGPGYSILCASIMLAVMILPTLVITSEAALRAVPKECKEAALACSGASHWQAIRFVMLPTASPGILAGIILGLGRVIGETTIVLMVTGNVPTFASSPLSPIRTLTANIALEMGESAGQHRQALYATAVILFLFVMLLNMAVRILSKFSASGKLGGRGGFA